MTIDFLMAQIAKLGGTLRFFPSDPDARIGIAEQIAQMTGDADQVRWLVARLPQLYADWPGMLEVRAVFCTRFRPCDGIEAALGSGSPAYAALCPEDRPVGALEEPIQLSRVITGDVAPPQQQQDISSDAEMRRIVSGVASRHNRRDPLASVKPATQDEIDTIKKIQAENQRTAQLSHDEVTA
jgi:hypothetical protein